MTTHHENDKQAMVPWYQEPIPGDKLGHADRLYTQKRWEGVLPTDAVVIPDTEHMYIKAENTIVFDLYEVGSLREEGASLPFVHAVELAGPKGEVVRFRCVFDDGALVNTIDEPLYQTLKGRLTALTPSSKVLRMADGRLVPSAGVWKGRITVKGIQHESTFEIFNSNGAWAMLFGKPLLRTFNAIHNYKEDSIRIPNADESQWTTLSNQFTNKQNPVAKMLANRTVDIKQIAIPPPNISHQNRKVTKGKAARRRKRTPKKPAEAEDNLNMYKIQGGLTTPLEGSLEKQPLNNPESFLRQNSTLH